ncbi:TetR/AcrR family transcriptional regulator [Knoellia sp. CPCC 206453]|uniref:TetR/AcrR family transcriptional regulator n=1 Tax=Knoellia pratensis TaxID=3404796 RepID=UPI003612E495
MALSREQIVVTALDLLRRYGLADLSMRRLARELDVQPGALYWHLASKQELLVEVADTLVSQVPLPAPDLPPAEALTALLRSVRATVAAVPDGSEVVSMAYAAAPSSVVPIREVTRLLGLAGVATESLSAVTDLVVAHVLGSVALEQTDEQLRAADPAHVGPAPKDRIASFEAGLGVILRGIAK